MPTRKQKENAIAGKFPPNAKRGRGANRILFMTGALADLIGVRQYDTVKVSELTDEQIDLLYNRLYNKTAGSLRSLEARIARLEKASSANYNFISVEDFNSLKPKQRVTITFNHGFMQEKKERVFEVGPRSQSKKYGTKKIRLYPVEDGAPIKKGIAPWSLNLRPARDGGEARVIFYQSDMALKGEKFQKRASSDPFFSVKHGIISALGGLKKLQKFIGAKVRDLGLRGKGVRIHFRLDHNAFRPYNMVEICLNDRGLYDMNFRRETHNRGRDVSYSDKVDNVPEGALSKTFERMTGLKLSRANRSLLPMRVALEARDPMMVLSEKIEREGKKAKSAIFSVSFETDRSMGLGQVRLILRYKFLTALAQLPSDKAQEARGEVSKLYEYAETLIGKTYGNRNYELEDWNTSAIQWIIDEH